jgi:hypothetical protein
MERAVENFIRNVFVIAILLGVAIGGCIAVALMLLIGV